MAGSAVAVKRFAANNYQAMVKWAPESTSPTNFGTWYDFSPYYGVAVEAMLVSGTSITDFQILAASDSSGTNPTTIVDSGTVAATTVGDYVFVEALQQQVAEFKISTGNNLRYIGFQATVGNSSDVLAVCFTFWKPRFPVDGLTASKLG